MNELYKPTKIKEVLKKYQFNFSKGLGQNFLVDNHIIQEILDRTDVRKEDVVIEIGPGFGTLTEEIADRAKKVISIEIDKRLINVLKDTLQDKDNVEIINQDVLKVDIRKLVEQEGAKRVKVIANLPYYITSSIIEHLFQYKDVLSTITVMVQKEVAQRMIARENTKDYGSFSVFVQVETVSEIIVQVPRTVFMPQPKVDSAVVLMECKERFAIKDKSLFYDLVHSGFGKRRKNIKNSLTKGFVELSKEDLDLILKELNLDGNLRAENLSIQDFINISNRVLTL